MDKIEINQAAKMLFEAEHANYRLDALPDHLRPASSAESYAIQDAIVAMKGPVGAWKLTVPRDDSEPTCAPIPGHRVFSNGSHIPGHMALALEIELGILLGRDISGAVTEAEIERSIEGAVIACELIGSRFRDRKAVSKLSALADTQSGGALVIGNPDAPWKGLDPENISMTLDINGEHSGSTTLTVPKPLYIRAIAWLAEQAGIRGTSLRAGQVIITGGRIGSIPIKEKIEVAAYSEQIGSLKFTVEP